jgi:hydrogenase small subunit
MKGKTTEVPVLWMQGAGCNGCSVSLLNATSPTAKNVLIDEVIPGKHLNLRFHPTIMAGQGEPAVAAMQDTVRKLKGGYVLVVEGSVQTGAGGGFCTIGAAGGKHITFIDALLEAGSGALAVIALGSCAAYGGIPSWSPNPTEAKGVGQVFREKGIKTPVINIPGCPPHPDWFVGTVAQILLGGLPKAEDLDDAGRPLAFFGKLIHENCPRRPYFDAGQFARKPGDEGCLYELGCKGPISYADCPTRLWNGGVNWCVGAGAPCSGCVEPDFPHLTAPVYRKVTAERMEAFKVKTK